MKTSLTEFVESLVDSSLMNANEVEAFVSRYGTKDAATLARLLVEHGRLTPYQTQAILQGAKTGLVLGD